MCAIVSYTHKTTLVLIGLLRFFSLHRVSGLMIIKNVEQLHTLKAFYVSQNLLILQSLIEVHKFCNKIWVAKSRKCQQRIIQVRCNKILGPNPNPNDKIIAKTTTFVSTKWNSWFWLQTLTSRTFATMHLSYTCCFTFLVMYMCYHRGILVTPIHMPLYNYYVVQFFFFISPIQQIEC